MASDLRLLILPVFFGLALSCGKEKPTPKPTPGYASTKCNDNKLFSRNNELLGQRKIRESSEKISLLNFISILIIES